MRENSRGGPDTWSVDYYSAGFVSYSHMRPRGFEQSLIHDIITEAEDAELTKAFGGLYTLPSDRGLKFVFQKH